MQHIETSVTKFPAVSLMPIVIEQVEYLTAADIQRPSELRAKLFGAGGKQEGSPKAVATATARLSSLVQKSKQSVSTRTALSQRNSQTSDQLKLFKENPPTRTLCDARDNRNGTNKKGRQ